MLKPFSVPAMVKRWKEVIAARQGLLPLFGVFTSDVGELNRWIDTWAYRSLDERLPVQNLANEQGIWPLPEESPILAMESKILLPAHFSPVK